MTLHRSRKRENEMNHDARQSDMIKTKSTILHGYGRKMITQ